MNDPLNYLGSIWYPSETSDVPYPPNQFLGWDFFLPFSYSKTLATQLLALVHSILSWLVCAEIEYKVQIALPQRPINQFSKADSRR